MTTRSVRDAEFCDFVSRSHDRLIRAATLLCGDPHRAEDLVQAALTKVYLRWAKLDHATSVQAYARRCVVTAHIDESRRPWRRERVPLEAIAEPAVVDGVPFEDAADLWEQIGALSKRQRQVLVLRHYWGLSVAETAADLGVSEGTVKSHDNAARTVLRGRLATSDSEGR